MLMALPLTVLPPPLTVAVLAAATTTLRLSVATLEACFALSDIVLAPGCSVCPAGCPSVRPAADVIDTTPGDVAEAICAVEAAAVMLPVAALVGGGEARPLPPGAAVPTAAAAAGEGTEPTPGPADGIAPAPPAISGGGEDGAALALPLPVEAAAEAATLAEAPDADAVPVAACDNAEPPLPLAGGEAPAEALEEGVGTTRDGTAIARGVATGEGSSSASATAVPGLAAGGTDTEAAGASESVACRGGAVRPCRLDVEAPS